MNKTDTNTPPEDPSEDSSDTTAAPEEETGEMPVTPPETPPEEEPEAVEIDSVPASAAETNERRFSIPAMVVGAILLAALAAGFFTLGSLRSDLDAKSDQIESLEEDLAAVAVDVQDNSNALIDASARTDLLEQQTAGLAESAANGGGSQVLDASTQQGPGPDGSLPSFAGNGLPDAAIGLPAPDVSGEDFLTGATVELASDKPTMVMMWAHWCPHCQNELPIVEQLYTEGVFEENGVELISVSTFEDPSRGNPFEEYVTSFSFPVIRDDRSRATLLGVSGVPSWVVVGADGTVIGRLSGALGEESLRGIIDQISAEG